MDNCFQGREIQVEKGEWRVQSREWRAPYGR